MTTADLLALLPLRFLLASLGCLVAGLSVWTLGMLLRRWLPALAAQRSLWLLAQATVLATFVLMLLPHSERVRLVPPIEEATRTVARLLEPAPMPLTAAQDGAAAPTSAPDDRIWLRHGAWAWLALYTAGLAWRLAHLWRAQRLLGGLAAGGTALAPCGGVPVVEVDGPISPMLIGVLRPRLLLPRHLRAFDPLQRHLIVQHELTHLWRRDPQWLAAGLILETLFWFNPFMRLLRDSLTWAQELGCDRAVLHGQPPARRKAYAAALVAQLKLQMPPAAAALAFGGVDAGTLARRLALIRTPAAATGLWQRCATVGALVGIGCLNIALQPALAWTVEPAVTAGAPLHCTALVDAASGQSLLRDGDCGVRVTPASTFNIAVSLMGYDSGFLQDQHAPKLPFKAGYADWNPSWRRPMDPQDWIRYSAVWYAQQVTTQLGSRHFDRYVQSFGYGNGDTSGDPGRSNGLTFSWISSSLAISADEQTAFLRRLVRRELPVSALAHEMTARLLRLDDLPGGWRVYGKTGTASPVGADGRDDPAHAYGWFVGWASKGERTIVFAHLVQDQHLMAEAAGPRARAAFLRDLPARLHSL